MLALVFVSALGGVLLEADDSIVGNDELGAKGRELAAQALLFALVRCVGVGPELAHDTRQRRDDAGSRGHPPRRQNVPHFDTYGPPGAAVARPGGRARQPSE